MKLRRWLIRATADFLLTVRFLIGTPMGRAWVQRVSGRIARSGLLAQDLPVPTRWLDVAETEPVFIADPQTSRVKLIGIVAGFGSERSFRKIAYKSKGHFLRRPPAICADLDSLKQAEAHGAYWFEAWDPQHKRLYRCPLSHFKTKGKFIEVDRGDNPQRGVLMTFLRVHSHEPTL